MKRGEVVLDAFADELSRLTIESAGNGAAQELGGGETKAWAYATVGGDDRGVVRRDAEVGARGGSERRSDDHSNVEAGMAMVEKSGERSARLCDAEGATAGDLGTLQPVLPWFEELADVERAILRAAEAKESGVGAAEPRSSCALGTTRAGFLSLTVSRDMLAGGTGCHEWEAGFALAERAMALANHLRHRRVLELGCGAGVAGVALARAGARTLLTDANRDALAGCAENARRNGLEVVMVPGTKAQELDGADTTRAPGDARPVDAERSAAAPHPWAAAGPCASLSPRTGEVCPLLSPAPSPPALPLYPVGVARLAWENGARGLRPQAVLGADLLYDPCAIPPLIALVDELLHESSYAVIVTTRRNEATLAGFLAAAAAHPRLRIAEVTSEATLRRDAPDAAAPSAAALWARAGAGEGPRFLCDARLDGARDRILFHMLWKGGKGERAEGPRE